MINVLVLAAGGTIIDELDGSYPFCLKEIDGSPLIEKMIIKCQMLDSSRILIAFADRDVQKFALDNIISILAADALVLSVKQPTRGAACTSLLFAESIDNDDELLIINGNEYVDIDFSAVVQGFRARALDAGVVVFPSVHPRYSFVKANSEGLVIEAAEKRPISRDAMVGFYWFSRGRDFVAAAKNMIRKDACVSNAFYVSLSINELVLRNARIGVHRIESSKFHPLKTERQVVQYENMLGSERR